MGSFCPGGQAGADHPKQTLKVSSNVVTVVAIPDHSIEKQRSDDVVVFLTV